MDPVENWLACARYDLRTASAMLASRQYIYVAFMSHLAVEKAIKAVIQRKTGTVPPRSHDLLHLIKLSGCRPAPEMLDFVGEINNASIPTRYPDDLKQMTREYNRKRVDNYLTQARGTIRWLSRQARSKR